MKKFLTTALLTGSLVAFSGLALADQEIKGTLTKIDGDFYVVKDQAGTEHRAHVDNSTKMKGNVKEGSTVELHVNKSGHATKIEEKK